MDDIVDKTLKQLKNLPKDLDKVLDTNKKQKAVVGAALGYVISKDEKERNAIIGGLIGYFIGKKQDEKEDKF